jgi:tight adherence protein C
VKRGFSVNINIFDQSVIFIILGFLIAVIGMIIISFGMRSWLKSGTKTARRLDFFIAPEQQQVAKEPLIKRIFPREVDGSLFNRTIVSWIKGVFTFIGRFTPEKRINALNHKLGIANHPMNMHAGEFYFVRVIFAAIGLGIAFLLNRDLKHLTLPSVALAILVFLFFFILPTFWLNSRVRARQDEIRRELPDVLDMLSVCASAGLGFDQSLQKIAGYWHTELGNELKRVIHEMEMGVSRAVALKNMSDRLDVDDLSRFIAIIIQAESLGMSYADVLHSQATQLRVLRQYRAREISNRLPARMIIPLALLIFPALITVILAPILPTLLNLF